MGAMVLLQQMITLFLIIFCGCYLKKIDILSNVVCQKLSQLILNVSMPCVIIYSVLTQSGERDIKKVGIVFLISVIVYMILPIAGFAIAKVMHAPRGQQGIYAAMFTYSNVGFMGFPVIEALYGSEALLYAAILNIIFNLSAYSMGITMMHYGQPGKDGAGFSVKSLLSPGIIGTCIALVFYFFPISLPASVLGAMDYIGGLTSPLAMLLIGANLANIKISDAWKDIRIWVFTFFKQLVFPLLCWPLFDLWITDDYIKGILFLLLIMPVGNTVVLFATRYKMDESLAVRGVFVTTICSVVTIPLLAMILHLG